MFKCYIGFDCGSPFAVCIEGCPAAGLDAIDFRRRHGIPDQPNNEILIPSFAWTDEEFVRANAHHADTAADLRSTGPVGDQVIWSQYPGGQWLSAQHNFRRNSYYPVLPADVILRYRDEQTPETGRLVFRALREVERRSRLRAAAGMYDLAREAGRQEALEWLEGDVDALAEACALADMEAEGDRV